MKKKSDALDNSPDLNLRLIVPLHDLARKVLDAEGGLQRRLDAVEVGF